MLLSHTLLLDDDVTDTLELMPRPASRFPDQSMIRTPWVDWAEFADGKVYPLRQGKHFLQEPEKARNAFITWCSRHGFQTHTVVGKGRNHGRLWVQAYNENYPPAAEDVVQ